MRKKFASSGNRTRAARVAGEHSTTEPTMLYELLAATYMGSCGGVVNATDSKSVSLWERRFESYQLRSFVWTAFFGRHKAARVSCDFITQTDLIKLPG